MLTIRTLDIQIGDWALETTSKNETREMKRSGFQFADAAIIQNAHATDAGHGLSIPAGSCRKNLQNLF
jgi:hypothetical protein